MSYLHPRIICGLAAILVIVCIVLATRHYLPPPVTSIDFSDGSSLDRLPTGWVVSDSEFSEHEIVGFVDLGLPENKVIRGRYERVGIFSFAKRVTTIKFHTPDMSLGYAIATMRRMLDEADISDSALDKWKSTAKDGQRGNNFRIHARRANYEIIFEIRAGYDQSRPWFVTTEIGFPKY